MSEIMQFLKTVDEEYLIGLSNKGIVKRSYKDLESVTVKITEEGEEILGQYDDISVRLKLPLTGSTCSCPSTSICKHVIMTILAEQKIGENATAQGENAGENATAQGENAGENTTAQGENTRENAADQGVTSQGVTQKSEKMTLGSRLLEIPTDRLRKAASDKEWMGLLAQTNWEEDFEIAEGSMITVRNRKSQWTVKLSWPTELSTCSACHNEKLCVHKAAAILAWQIRNGVVTPEVLAEETVVSEDDFDSESIPEVLADAKALLDEMLLVGSARLSPETPLGLERLSLRAHGAKLPNLEEMLRVLSEMVSGYHARRASITAAELLRKIVECHELLGKLERAVSEGKGILTIAGAFRSEYMDVPELLLHGIAMREFRSASGYAGKTIYFFEEGSRAFYTYTAARPTIYEKAKRRGNAGEQVPWELPCTLLQLCSATVRLRDGKANAEGRLSSTSQAHAELLRVGGALPDVIGEIIFDDFEEMWKAYLARSKKAQGDLSEVGKLFLLRPKDLLSVEYDEVRQKSVFYLEDFQGRRLRGELAYSKLEETAIRSLERMYEKRKRQEEELPVFFGSIYVRDGECIFYPIETVEKVRLEKN